MTDAEAGVPASFVVECPGCRGPLAVRSDLPFRAARCPLCSGEFLIPKAEPPVVRTPPPPAGLAAPLLHRDETPSFSLPAPPPGSQAPAPPRTELYFEEPVKTIATAAGTVTLRRLSPGEKQARRTRRNLIMLCGGAMILFLIVLLLGRDKRRR